ncbi:MAG: SsrA-binding protein SmpB [Parcubacteria group bacterium]|nr:SsrA-binding protein SmpB [Parcubacteria group bacterium]
MRTYSLNRRARFDYDILETYEAGIVLSGHEVKSVKTGHMNLAGSFVIIRASQAYLINAIIPPYQAANTPAGYVPTRSRKLLLHASEISSLIGKHKEQGLTLVPIRVYTTHGRLKLEFGIGRGKRKYDKRETIRRREAQRSIARALRIRSRPQ